MATSGKGVSRDPEQACKQQDKHNVDGNPIKETRYLEMGDKIILPGRKSSVFQSMIF